MNIIQKILAGLPSVLEWLCTDSFRLVEIGTLLIQFFPSISMLIDARCGPGPDFANVNSLYGPGTFLAWLVSCLFVLLTNIDDCRCRRLKLEMSNADRPWACQESFVPPIPEPLGFLGVYIYAGFAAIDALVRSIRGSVPEDDAKANAALIVFHYAVFIGFTACLVSSFIGTRSWPWRLLASTCAFPIVVNQFNPKKSDVRLYDDLRTLAALLLATGGFVTVTKEESIAPNFESFFPVNFIYFGIGLSLLFWGKAWWRDPSCHDIDGIERSITIIGAWPKSSANWLDLDQLAAIAAASVVLGFGFLVKNERGQRLGQRFMGKLVRLISKYTDRNSGNDPEGDYRSGLLVELTNSDSRERESSSHERSSMDMEVLGGTVIDRHAVAGDDNIEFWPQLY